jgi:aldehyde dehydrogenase (NAD+)
LLTHSLQIFGPVICVGKFKTEDEALALANNTTYGLAAAVHTNDAKQATRVTSNLVAGTVWCNQYGMLHTGVPFGGFKMSGIGRELGTAGLESYLQIKSVHHNLTQACEWPI